jgi:hypothetical protein
VADANSCTSVTSVTITQPTQLTASSSAGTIACYGDSTTVTVTASGGTSPYSGTGSFTRAAGSYTFTVTDANSCTSVTSVTITQPTQLTASSSAGTIACYGDSTTVTVTASGGTSPYSGTGSFTRGAGSYTFTVTDANGCTSVTSVTITQPTQLTASSSAGTITCYGGTTTVTISASGGVPPYSGTGTASSVGAGNYSYTIIDANGCSAVTSITVTQPAQIVVTSFSPLSGGTGTVVTINGSGFTGTTDVLFNGVSASGFSVISDVQLTAVVPAAATTGVITVQNGTCTGSSTTNFTTNITLSLKFFLQGYYQGSGLMSRPLYTLGYTADSTISDSATIRLYSPSDLTTPAYSFTGRFHTDGSMSCTFSGSAAGDSFYIAIVHKNHLMTWSKDTVLFGNTTTYDFTTAASKGYADQLADLGDGSFASYAGDFTNGTTDGVQDGYINGADYNSMENLIPLGQSGTYLIGDLDGDGYVNGVDYSILQNNVPLGITMARPF